MKKRWLSILLVCGMVLTMLPSAAFAEDGEPKGCVCTEACTAETQNADCPICGAEDAALEDCAQYETNQENELNDNQVQAVPQEDKEEQEPEEQESKPQVEAQAVQSDKPVAVQVTNAAHQHCYCGGSVSVGDHTSHKDVNYQPWNGTDSITYTNGEAYVYLTENATLPGKNLEVTDGNHLYLCLNGHELASDDTHKITVNTESQLTISDCAGGGTIKGATSGWGGMCIYIYHSTVDLFGGKLTGGKVTGTGGGGAIALDDADCVLNLYGGEITGNDGNQRGGGILMLGGTLNMYGGYIHDNTAGYWSGNLYIGSGATMNAYGGKISRGCATYDIRCYGTIQNPDPSMNNRGTSLYCGVFLNTGGRASGCTYYGERLENDGAYVGSPIEYWIDYDAIKWWAHQDVPAGKGIYPPDEPSREGYTFVGWYDLGGSKFNFGTLSDGSRKSRIILVAHWTHNNHADENNDHKCDGCGETLSEHTGGTATCTEQAICAVCGEKYGERNAQNHTGTTAWIQTATTHMQKYQCCGAIVVAEEAHQWEKGACAECGYVCQHSGGTATCTEQATCAICGEAYGDLADHSFTAEVADEQYLKSEATCTEAAVYYKSCAVCGLASTETFVSGDPLGHDYSTEWSQDDTHHWHVCSRCDEIADLEAHTASDWIVDTAATAKSDGEKHRECAVCGYTMKTGTIPATGSQSKTGKKDTAKSAKSVKTKTPKTGDSSNRSLWMTLLLLSAFGVAAIALHSRKNRAKE